MEPRIVARYMRATEDERVLEPVVDDTLDRFISLLVAEDPLDEKKVSQALQNLGITPEMVNSSDPQGKEAGETIRALGGLVRKALWYLLLRPFKLLARSLSSSSFRSSIKQTFWKALKRDARASRHLIDVFGRKLSGEPVHPQEMKNARRQLVTLLGKAFLIYLTGPQFLAAFNGPIWSGIVTPVVEVLYTLLATPITAVSKRLMTEDLG